MPQPDLMQAFSARRARNKALYLGIPLPERKSCFRLGDINQKG
jgi:hypothetical protein